MHKNYNIFRMLLSVAVMSLFTFAVTAQNLTKAQQLKQIEERIKQDNKVEAVTMSPERVTPYMITFDTKKADAYQLKDAKEVIEKHLDIKEDTKFDFHKEIKLANGLTTYRFEQFYKGVKVEHGDYVALAQPNKKLASINGEHYKLEGINTTPTLTLEQAIDIAKEFIGAETYSWDYVMENYRGMVAPELVATWYKKWDKLYGYQSEVVIVDDYDTMEEDLDLAYKLNVYGFGPMSRD